MTERSQRWSSLLARAWDRHVLPRPDLEVLRRDAARLEERLGEARPAPWRLALEALVDSLDREARLNAVGLTFASVQLSALLRQRERAAKIWRERPAILASPVDRPIIILGQMRSGTTRLQRLLGCDPRLNHSRFYEVMRPVPPPIDMRIARSWMELKLLNFLNSELATVHPTSATAVEEIFGLFSFCFYGAQFEAQWRVPGFARQWEAQDRSWVYAEVKNLIRTIGGLRGDAGGSWVLKAPQFMEDLDFLLDAFPDARLVCLQRSEDEIVASSASLVWHQMRIQSDGADPHWIGREWLRKSVRRAQISEEVRKNRPDVPQIEIRFADVGRDWRCELRRLYAFLDMDLPVALERRMEDYLAGAERSGFRGHRYGLADFGLTPEEVSKAFGSRRATPYIDGR